MLMPIIKRRRPRSYSADWVRRDEVRKDREVLADRRASATLLMLQHQVHGEPNRTSALFLKAKAGTDVALAGQLALDAGFVSERLRVRQVVLRRRSAPIILVIKGTISPVILRRCRLHRNQ